MKKILYLLTLALTMTIGASTFAQDSTDVYGCMDPNALNYNPSATIDNGSCIYYCDSTQAYFWYAFYSDTVITAQSFTYSLSDPISYFWDFGDGNSSSVESPTHVYTEAGVYDICFTITAQGLDSNTTCSSTYCDSIVVSEGTLLIITDQIYGCTDPAALNYNPLANIDDGTCFYATDVYGCTDPMAINYNPLATIDDGSCIYQSDSTIVYGCMDPMALNYNPLATIDDGSCIYNDTTDVYGCMDPMALNYNPLATIDDGSCIYSNDSTNVFGCMDTSALNYNPLATIDDGSCIYYCDSTQAYFYISNIDENNGIITIVNNSTSSDPITSYLWNFDDGTTSTEAYPTHEYASSGMYVVCLTIAAETANGNLICTSTYCDTIGIPPSPPGFGPMSGFTINVVAEGTTGVDEIEFSNLKLYPNPARENLILSYSLEKQTEIITTIYDLGGRALLTFKRNASSGMQKETINISDLPSGMYQLELRNNNSRNVHRFQVIK